MGVHEGRGSLTKSMKLLMHQWTEARGAWDDSVSRGFEEKFLFPLEQDLRNALSAMDHMAVLLQQIRNDCR